MRDFIQKKAKNFYIAGLFDEIITDFYNDRCKDRMLMRFFLC